MRPLNVLHVVPAVAAGYGGPSVAVVGMCRAMGSDAVRTAIVTTDADGRDRLPVRIGEWTTHEGVPAMFFERVGPDSFKWARGLASWLRAHVRDYDVVHIHALLSYPALAASRACRAAGVPYIVRPLGTLEPWSLGRHAWRKRLLMALSGTPALRGASAIHYTSAEEARRTSVALPWLQPGTTIPLGIDDEMFARETSRDDADLPYVLAMCRLDPKKGIDDLIRAFHLAAAAESRWRLVIAGTGDPGYVQELQELAQSGPAAARIAFCGWVDGETRRTWLRGASLFALPSHQENFGIAVAQAMAAGVAVLVTPAVGLSDDIAKADAGWVCDRPSLARTLGEALASPADCVARGRRARQLAEQYRWARVSGALAALYTSLASRGIGTATHGNPRVAVSVQGIRH